MRTTTTIISLSSPRLLSIYWVKLVIHSGGATGMNDGTALMSTTSTNATNGIVIGYTLSEPNAGQR